MLAASSLAPRAFLRGALQVASPALSLLEPELQLGLVWAPSPAVLLPVSVATTQAADAGCHQPPPEVNIHLLHLVPTLYNMAMEETRLPHLVGLTADTIPVVGLMGLGSLLQIQTKWR